MAQILKFTPSVNSFDPETLAILGAAYDHAVADLTAFGHSKSIREFLAARIILAATRGERDLDSLYKLALRGIA
jgi:hypothetical protein